MKVDFKRLTWENYPSTETPLSAENLNRLEEGVAGLYSDVAEIEQEVEQAMAAAEAATTVRDGSLTYKKLVTGTLGFVTPEMFGAVGDGETDDYNAFADTITFAFQNNINLISCANKNYYISQALNINGHNLTIDGNFCNLIFDKSGFVISETSYNIKFCNMVTQCTFEKGSTGTQFFHFGIVGATATARYLAHDIFFKNISMTGGVFGVTTNSAKNINIENCDFSSFMYAGNGGGGYAVLLQSSIDVTIRKCSFSSGLYGRHDIYVSVDPSKTTNKECENIVIDECYFTHENLELDNSGHYYSPSTIPIQVRATTGISISNCKVYSAVGFAVFLGTEGAIVGANARNIIIDSPVYNSGASEQKSIISLNGGTYGADVKVDGLNALNVPSNYLTCVELTASVFKLSNAKIGATRITSIDSILYLNNIESAINEYFVRFYGTSSGDISDIKCTGLTNPLFKYYIDSAATVNQSIFESKTATLEFTTLSSGGFTDYQDYPDGFYYTLCTVIGIEVCLNGSWRSGNVVARTSVNTRTFVSLESGGIRLFNDESNLYGYQFRVTIKQIK